jgi:hypothetical protein
MDEKRDYEKDDVKLLSEEDVVPGLCAMKPEVLRETADTKADDNAARSEPAFIADESNQTKMLTIPLHSNSTPFGIAVDWDDGKTLIINAINPGQVHEWNLQQPESRKVSVGDRIMSVSSIVGDPNQLLDLLNSQASPVMEIRHHREFSLPLQRADGQRLGFSLRFREDGNTLLIKSIGEGLISQWNADNKGQEVVAGDRIVEVNGTRGPGCDLDELLRQQGTLTLVLVRFNGDSP